MCYSCFRDQGKEKIEQTIYAFHKFISFGDLVELFSDEDQNT